MSACVEQNIRTEEQPTGQTAAESSLPVIQTVESDTEIFELPEIKDTTIWPRIRSGFQIEEDLEHRSIQAELQWYKKNKSYLNRVMKRSEPFLHYILEEIEKEGLPTELVLLPIVESAFQPFAYSHGRAAGLWQFIPSTGRLYGLKQDWWYDGRRDVLSSTQAAIQYLKNLNKIFKGDWLLALAAYNSGPGTVQKAIARNKRLKKSTNFWHLRIPRETRAYVPKLLALKEIIAHPRKHEVTLRCIQDIPGFEVVDIEGQIDLALAAELAETDVETIYRYNPAFNRWATSPNGPHRLLLSAESAELFRENISFLEDDQRIKWKRHKIKTGETLGEIAERYKTTVRHLKRANKLRNNTIRAGRYLLIPVASKSLSQYALSATQRKKAIQGVRKGDQKITHTVTDGESFWLIARRYGVGMHELAKWNGMAVRDRLRIGQKLVIWKQNGKQVSNLARIWDKPTDNIRSISYTVRNGDSLSRIASRYQVSINDIHRWNDIQGKYLQPGQKLKLFVDITNQAGG